MCSKPGDYVYVPRGTVHRNQNMTNRPVRSIELNITDKGKPQTGAGTLDRHANRFFDMKNRLFEKEPNMRMLWVGVAGMAALMSISGCTEQKTGLAAVADAMGATNLNTIEYAGTGSLFGFGQAFLPGEPWPRFEQRDYRVSINYQTPAMRLDSTRSQGEHPRMAARHSRSRRTSARSRMSAASLPGPKPATKPTPIPARSGTACARCGRRRRA